MTETQIRIIDNETGEIVTQGMKFTKTSLTIDPAISYDRWGGIGGQLDQIEGAIQWWIGDWLNFGERKYGEMYAQAVDERQNHTWRQYKYVSNTIKLSTRVDNLSWTHHREIANLEPKEQSFWLKEAVNNEYSVSQLKRAVKEFRYKKRHLKELMSDNISENIINGDFREINITPNSVDLILTDPPYGIEFADTWNALGRFANRVLKPSRFLISYFGQVNLIDFYNAINSELEYYWTFCLKHSGNNQLIMSRNIFCGWKPILVFQKAPFSRLDIPMDDFIIGSGREKDSHEWQQALDELIPLIDHFTIENELILDPFAGSGTTVIAALSKNRHALGIEIDESYCKIATERIREYENTTNTTS